MKQRGDGCFDFEHLKDRARFYSVLTCRPEPLYCIWSLLGENYSACSNYPEQVMERVITQSFAQGTSSEFPVSETLWKPSKKKIPHRAHILG